MLYGHLWTVGGHLKGKVTPPELPPSRAWFAQVSDARLGAIRLSGRWSHVPGSRELLVIVHGLGGSSRSPYTHRAARSAWDAGLSSLRINLRGADGLGEDLYHAGLASDLEVLSRSPELRGYQRLFLLGYSLGGHVCLAYATQATDPRVVSAAAICSPLDLGASARAFDAPRFSVYRKHVLDGLRAMHRAVATRRGPPFAEPEALAGIRRIQDWDEAVVAPRHGFESAAAYYRSQSVGPVLGQVRIPSLVLHTQADPMVPIDTIRPWTETPHALVSVVESRHGGHVALPSAFDMGSGSVRGLEAQVLHWLRGIEGFQKPHPRC